MPTAPVVATWDGYASENNLQSSTGTQIWVGSNSAVINSNGAILFEDVQIDRGSDVTAFPLSLYRDGSFSSTASLVMQIAAHKVANAAIPADPYAILTYPVTTAKVSVTIPAGSLTGRSAYDIAPVIKEIVAQAGWVKGNDILVLIKPTGGTGGGTGTGGRRMAFGSLQSSEPPTAEATFTPPGTTGAVSFGETATDRLAAVASAEEPDPPAPVVGTTTHTEVVKDWVVVAGHKGDVTRNTPFDIEAFPPDSHAFVTAGGELLPFAARFDRTLGGVRSEMLGSSDATWYPESGLLTREAAALPLQALLIDREDPQRAGDRFARLLPEARQLVLPDGLVLDLHSAQHTGRPEPYTLDVLARPKGAFPRHPLLSGQLGAAFETFGSTPELPIYGVDTAGGPVAPLLASRWDSGCIVIAVRLTERTRQSIVSVGLPVDAFGETNPGSLCLWWDRNTLVASLRGAETRVRETFLGPFGTVLVLVLRWTLFSATLTTRSSYGLKEWELAIGTPTELSAKEVSAGRRLDGVGSGAFVALGLPFLSVAPGSLQEAGEAAEGLYRHLTAPGLSWEVRPPDFALELARADSKALEVAPGDSLTFRLSVLRVGGYAGDVDFSVTTGNPLVSASWVKLPSDGATDLYDVTLAAAPSLPEGAVTFSAWALAQGADNPGSLLANVRDMLSGVLEVSATPAIAANASVEGRAFDPTLQRDAEVIKDSSANANVLTWSGYARPNRRYHGLLCTGVRNAAVYSGALANAGLAQRMSGNATVSLILAELNKTKTGGVLFQYAAADSDNDFQVVKADGGLKLRTVNGAATVTSPDTLPYLSAYTKLIALVESAFITLLDRDTGRSVQLARPAWPDAGVRVTLGARRSAAGVLADLARANVLAYTVHPYALSDIQRRRNLDALLPFCLADDGKGEFPDNALVIALFGDNTAEQPAEKFRNRAAPALGVAVQTSGTVASIAGGVSLANDNSHVFVNTGVPSSEVSALLTTILDFPQGVAYGAQVSFNDSASNAANATLTRHGSQQAFPMQGLTDLSHNYKTVGEKVPLGKSSFAMRLFNAGRSLELTELQKGSKGTVTGNVNWTGNVVLALGLIKRSGGGFADQSNTKNLGLVYVRGEFSADDIVTTKQLLSA